MSFLPPLIVSGEPSDQVEMNFLFAFMKSISKTSPLLFMTRTSTGLASAEWKDVRNGDTMVSC